MTVLEWLDKTKDLYAVDEEGNRYKKRLRPRILCKDGWNISVQESPIHHSLKIDWYYRSVELGFLYEDSINEADLKTLMPYAEIPDDPDNYIWNYVPISILQEICDRHGGVVGACEYTDECKLVNVEI